jgi:hypothetical protein
MRKLEPRIGSWLKENVKVFSFAVRCTRLLAGSKDPKMKDWHTALSFFGSTLTDTSTLSVFTMMMIGASIYIPFTASGSEPPDNKLFFDVLGAEFRREFTNWLDVTGSTASDQFAKSSCELLVLLPHLKDTLATGVDRLYTTMMTPMLKEMESFNIDGDD